ncbi:MAG: UvrD-helicase domain-containing protein [Thiogranum sp.]|nr:UvrD-helicase domain-containing protein [Thiogranum sp.]
MRAKTSLATDPQRSFSVLASAGTGKTWQLVARLTRLLLRGARLDSILAITFTRKAAGEMQARLSERLRELLEADDAQLVELLEQIGETPAPAVCDKARKLLEHWLRSEQPLRTTTFHSFCQELLQRFPLEAGLPPGFELAEQTGLLIGEAWDALFAEATSAPDTPLAAALERLFENLNGLHNTRGALFNFVEHRSDWWAFTREHDDPVRHATDYLKAQLQLDRNLFTSAAFWNDATRDKLAEFGALLGRHDTKGNQSHAALITDLLSGPADADAAVAALGTVFFTGTGERRKRSSSKAQQKSMGLEGEARFLELHDGFCEQLERLIEQQNREQTFRNNSAWYRAGQRILEHFQRIKRERRLLDFADLEWNAYQLLNHPEHAHWVQYKLDQRIDHLLIDEFQDTNPTQWQLILPLLQEMAAGGERERSLFVVGDSKQSIYRFRRGNPQLLDCAADWMAEHLQAESIHLDASRRSSPAVLEVVNKVFLQPEMRELMPGFQEHSTHKKDAWGRVELWPLIEADVESTDIAYQGLRNPLQHPRPVTLDRRYYREGQAIAQRIRELVSEGIAGYNDILILMRTRTHLADYEAALRDSGIPYLSLDRGTLLQSLEIRDLEALLLVLMTPQDNLSLAQVLRSPIFSASDQDLMLLAQHASGPWIERLEAVVEAPDAPQTLARADRLLKGWRALAGHIPIHDLLERIFHEANLLNRYQAAFPETQTARVRANLTRFIELALEVDSGRYPTLPRFLDRVRQLRSLDKEGPDQATPEAANGERVCLLTIHAAKGLEAPVVFLADSTNPGTSPPGCQTLVRWPAEADRPTDFLLLNNSKQRDSISQSRYELEQAEDNRESANLLYVAMTRAKHMLVITGCVPSRNKTLGWYQQVSRAVCDADAAAQPWIHTFGEPERAAPAKAEQPQAPDIDPRLSQPIPTRPVWREIAPSRTVEDAEFEAGDALGRLRGIAIHRMLQLATDTQAHDGIVQRVAAELKWSFTDATLEQCWDEVQTLLHDRELAWLFRPGDATKVFNEVPIQYRHNGQTVYGIIDRLLVSDGQVQLVDYKSHRIAEDAQVVQLAEHYRPQMALYREGVQRLWPDIKTGMHLLFTDGGRLFSL